MSTAPAPLDSAERWMENAPKLGPEERLDLADWMVERIAGADDATDPLILPAQRYVADKMSLPVGRIQPAGLLFDEVPTRLPGESNTISRMYARPARVLNE